MTEAYSRLDSIHVHIKCAIKHAKTNIQTFYKQYNPNFHKQPPNYQSLFSGRTFSFFVPAADLRSSGDRKNKLGPSLGFSK